jgi:UDP-N-acetylmuramoylalanine-D-glutamate ligase
LLNGSATKKMIRELKKINYFRKRKALVFENLASILKKISRLQITKSKLPTVLLFSPAAASFEKFKNEFDRGKRFNLYFKKHFLGRR